MTAHAIGTDPMLAEGQVVEIFEKAHELRAKVLLRSDTVLEVTVGPEADVHLGDEVQIEGAVVVRAIRVRAETAEP